MFPRMLWSVPLAEIDVLHLRDFGAAVAVVAGLGILAAVVMGRLVVQRHKVVPAVTLMPKSYQCLLLPMSSKHPVTDDLLYMAAQLIGRPSTPATVPEGKPVRILLTYLIEVPRSLRLGEAMPDAEAGAQVDLEHAAQMLRAQGGEPILMTQQARSFEEEVLKIARDEDVDGLLLPALPPVSGDRDRTNDDEGLTDPESGDASDLYARLLRRATCEVLLSRPRPNDT